jgi:hypothetical protein
MLQAIGGFVMLVANDILISHTLINSYALGNPNNSKHDGGYQDGVAIRKWKRHYNSITEIHVG